MVNCYRDNRCYLGTDKKDCWDFEPQDGNLEYEEKNEEDDL